MLRPENIERFQDHQGKRALPDVFFIAHEY